ARGPAGRRRALSRVRAAPEPDDRGGGDELQLRVRDRERAPAAPGDHRVSAPRRPSAGLLMFRRAGGTFEVFLVHPGGPFWANKDLGAWSIPKGVCEPDEPPLEAARR